ncbi:ABC transporter substrate-binding protein [Robinsoniella sp. KNHs210]|uniref:ABC transporter substrate-binding protein n=1 Tax=Robinsoniella sp. KNHs210 TaxID=1469950 RepID=UPI00047FEBFF|nr:ABC transporter substrate-binding protein [Robinsoniella sp. KNHs210]
MKRKKLVALGLAAVMAAGALTGCGGASTDKKKAVAEGTTDSGEKQEAVNIKIHTIISDQQDGEAVMDALNEYTREKIGVTVDYVFHGGAYADKIQTIIASGEEYDACFTSNWLNPYNTNVAKGAFLNIQDLLPEAAPQLYKLIPDYMWEGVTVDSGIYAIPNQQIVARQMFTCLSKEFADFAESKGIKTADIKDLKTAENYAQVIYDEYGAKLGGIDFTQSSSYCGYECISDYLSAGVIKMDDKTARVVNFYETDEWMDLLKELEKLNAMGLLDGECGYMPEYAESQSRANKISLQYGGTYKPGVEAEEEARRGMKFVTASTMDVPPYISTNSITATMYGISVTSKHPEETLKYLQLINTDPYAINLLAYGIEGKHYEKIDDHFIRTIPDSGYSHGQSWGLGNVFNTYALDGQPEDVWAQTKAMNDSAVVSPILGFSFNSEPVKSEITNVAKVVKQYESLVGGELPVEETNEEFLKKLDVAGIDTIIAEMQKQVDAFLAKRG